MAVVPMQKVRTVIHQNDVAAFLTVMQRAGAMQFSETEIEHTQEAVVDYPHAQLFPRVLHAVSFLELSSCSCSAP